MLYGKLIFDKPVIFAMSFYKFFVRSSFYDFPLVHDEYSVCLAYGTQSMGYEQYSPSLVECLKFLDYSCAYRQFRTAWCQAGG